MTSQCRLLITLIMTLFLGACQLQRQAPADPRFIVTDRKSVV